MDKLKRFVTWKTHLKPLTYEQARAEAISRLRADRSHERVYILEVIEEVAERTLPPVVVREFVGEV